MASRQLAQKTMTHLKRFPGIAGASQGLVVRSVWQITTGAIPQAAQSQDSFSSLAFMSWPVLSFCVFLFPLRPCLPLRKVSTLRHKRAAPTLGLYFPVKPLKLGRTQTLCLLLMSLYLRRSEITSSFGLFLLPRSVAYFLYRVFAKPMRLTFAFFWREHFVIRPAPDANPYHSFVTPPSGVWMKQWPLMTVDVITENEAADSRQCASVAAAISSYDGFIATISPIPHPRTSNPSARMTPLKTGDPIPKAPNRTPPKSPNKPKTMKATPSPIIIAAPPKRADTDARCADRSYGLRSSLTLLLVSSSVLLSFGNTSVRA